MTKRKFHIGDRVIGNGIQSSEDIGGLHGEIVGELYEGVYQVSFDEYNKYFHNCDGLAEKGHGWNCRADVLLPEEEVRVEIGACLPELSLLLM